MTDNDIKNLCLELQPIYQEWITRCHAAGLATKAVVTWRSPIDQDTAKAHGLSNAAAGQSPHNCYFNGRPASKAFDFAVFDTDAHYIKDGTDHRYTQAGEIGEDLGLVWGGRWKHPDFDHLELPNWRTEQAEPVTA